MKLHRLLFELPEVIEEAVRKLMEKLRTLRELMTNTVTKILEWVRDQVKKNEEK